MSAGGGPERQIVRNKPVHYRDDDRRSSQFLRPKFRQFAPQVADEITIACQRFPIGGKPGSEALRLKFSIYQRGRVSREGFSGRY